MKLSIFCYILMLALMITYFSIIIFNAMNLLIVVFLLLFEFYESLM